MMKMMNNNNVNTGEDLFCEFWDILELARGERSKQREKLLIIIKARTIDSLLSKLPTAVYEHIHTLSDDHRQQEAAKLISAHFQKTEIAGEEELSTGVILLLYIEKEAQKMSIEQQRKLALLFKRYSINFK